MCGIVAYLGRRPVLPILIEGLKRLEYRGYDSAGVAYIRGGQLCVQRAVGRIAALEQRLAQAHDLATSAPSHRANALPANGHLANGHLANGHNQAPVPPSVFISPPSSPPSVWPSPDVTPPGVRQRRAELLAEFASATEATGPANAPPESQLSEPPTALELGLGHTRWATHGGPSETNAHPHCDEAQRIALVHNGIIENHAALREYLQGRGHVFTSETDTEVLVHLIEEFYTGDLQAAVQAALREARGAYGIAVVCRDHPGTLVAARNGSPLIVGVGASPDGHPEHFVASDAAAIVAYTRQVVYLNDHEVVCIRDGQWRTSTLDNIATSRPLQAIELSIQEIERDGYEHFMLKEIFEQPRSLAATLAGRIDPREGMPVLGGLRDVAKELARARRLVLTGCGTAFHAGLVGEYLIETLARLPVEVEYASEFRYRNPILDEGTIVVGISQSGETADTLAALREARLKGALALGVVNTVGSSIARQTDAGVYLHAGPEIGVASTKAFTSQVAVMALLACWLGRRRHLGAAETATTLKALQAIPEQIAALITLSDQIAAIAAESVDRPHWLYLGRGPNYPIALEGALKLKEISYIHAEGLAAAEMKHGPIALITPGMPVVVIAPRCAQYDKVLSNLEEVRSRGGRIIAIATEGDTAMARRAAHTIFIPPTLDWLYPLLTVVPLQLLAYHAAVHLGHDVDKPRNLAKSVTVE